MKMNRRPGFQAARRTGSSPLEKGRKVGFYEAVLPDPEPGTGMAGSPLGEKLLILWGFVGYGAGSAPGSAG